MDAVGDRAVVIAGVGTNDTAHSIDNARVGRAAGRPRPAGRDPVLQPADAGRPAPPLHRGRRRHRPAGDALRHPAALAWCRSRWRRSSGSRSTRGSSRSRTPRATSGAVAWTLARTDLAYYSGDDILNFPLLALGAVGVVSVVGHIVGPRLAELVAAVESGDLVKARAVNESLLPVYTRRDGRRSGRHDGQGGAEPARACPRGRCGRRWSTPPPTRSRSCARTSPRAASQL